MLDQSKDKESLIKQLLTTRLGNDEADRIAKKLLSQNLSNSQIVEQLKRHFNSQEQLDDILNGVINDAKDKNKRLKQYYKPVSIKTKLKLSPMLLRVYKRTNQISWISFTLRLKARQMIY